MDLLLPTSQETVEAMFGDLSLVAQFPDRTPVVLSGITDDESRTKNRRHLMEFSTCLSEGIDGPEATLLSSNIVQ